jgi:hypothetical protein
VTQVPQRSITLKSSCCPEATSVFLLPTHLQAVLAISHTARYVTRPVGPALAGLLQPLGLALPFLVAGAVKSAYDLALWRLFRPIQLPTDTAAITGGAS